MHPFRANGEGWGQGSHAPFPRVRRGVPVCTPSVRVEPGAVCTRIPRTDGVARPMGREASGWREEGRAGAGGEVERRGGVPSCTPLLREWERKGSGQRRMPLPRVRGGADKREGAGANVECPRGSRAIPLSAWPSGKGPGAACPRAYPFCANGEGRGRGEGAAARTGGRERRGTGETRRTGGSVIVHRTRMDTWGKGRGWGGVPSCAAFPHEQGVLEGKRRGLTYVCPLSALEWGGGQCGGRGRRGRGRLTLVHPCLRTKGAARDAGDGEGRRPVLLRPLFDANGKGGGDGRATGMGGREEREGTHSILYKSGGMQSVGRMREWGGKVGVARQGDARGQADASFPCITRREGRMRIGAHNARRPSAFSVPPHLRGRVAHEGMPPPPLFPSAALIRGRVAPGPSPSHLAAPPCTRGKGDGTQPGGTPRRPPPLPSCLHRPIRAEGARDAGHPPFLSHSRGRGAHDGTPPRLSTSPPAPALPSSRHPDASLPIGRATPSARGTRVHAAPGSTRAEGVHAGTPCRTRGKGACDPRPHPSPFARKGVHAGTPLRSREQGLTRPSRVGQQDRRGLRAPTFTMPAPHFRAP
ncbi:hypothetical protein EDB86DRAFT_2834650 [Lactarius hatsudake]|nr:hypothetical protein EDB86DRAFT_2834650 [Lactarius hatsudake]